MKIRLKIPLHLKIFIALITGVIFGAIFKISPTKLEIKYYDKLQNKKSVTIVNWDSLRIKFELVEESVNATVTVFRKFDQVQIIRYFNKHKTDKTSALIEIFFSNKNTPVVYKGVIDIEKVETLATQIKPLGTIFIRLLSFLAIPLVIASLIVGAASLGDIKKLGRIGIKTLGLYISTTIIAILIGLVVVNVISPGERLSENTKNRLMGTYQSFNTENITEEIEVDIIDFLINIVPKNPFEAISSGNMLQIVFFAVMFGITLLFVERNKSEPIVNFFSGISDTMIKMVGFIMKLAPLGVFALISATIADFGFDIISTLMWYIIAVLLGLLIHTIGTYSILVKYFGKMKATYFFQGMRNAQAIAFSTSSSAATLPVTFDCVENKLGVSKQISGFVLPLGATINMDGTALYQGIAAVFIAQVYGIELSITEQLTIVLTALLASIGTAPVPGVGIIMLVMILRSINVPAEGIALILGVDRILDMSRTITNITGDAAVAVSIAGVENKVKK